MNLTKKYILYLVKQNLLLLIVLLRGHTETLWTAMGEEVWLAKLSTKGEGGQKSQKNGPHSLCIYENNFEQRHLRDD